MRKSRTGKKIARTIALGLATMVTLTSVPVSTLADSSGTPIPVENHTDGEKETIVPQEAKAVEDVEKLITKEDTLKVNAETGKEEFDPGVDQAIDIAQDAVKKTNENEAEDKDIKNADGKVSETLTDLQNAEKYMKDAAQSDQDAMNILLPKEGAPEIPVYIMVPVYETDENGVEKKDAEGNLIPVYETDEEGNIKTDEDGTPIQKFAPQLVVGTEKDENGNDKDVTYDEADSKTGSYADDAIRNANTANTTNSQKIAEQAKAAAESSVSDAKQGLADIEKKLEADSKKAAAAQEAYNKADKENKKAQKAVEDAQAQLDEALKKAVDENGDPITDKNGNPIYEGDVEAAEQALIAAKKTADEKAQAAQQAWNDAQNASYNEIVDLYDSINKRIKEQKDKSEKWDDDKYWEQTRLLCNLMIKNYIRSSEKDNGLVVGDDFEVQVINKWEPDGEPHTILDEEGNVVLDGNGAPVLWQDYKVSTENGYVTFKENKNTGYLYDQNGITVSGQTERKVYNWHEWIPSGYSYTGADGKKKEDKYIYNHVVVTYNRDTGKKDENGDPIVEKVIELYNYKNDTNGEIYIYKRDWNVEDDKNNVLVEASDYELGNAEVPKGDDTPASWATGTDENSRKITINSETGELELPDENTHAVARGDNEDGTRGGYWVIDANSKDVSTDEDKKVVPPVKSTQNSGNTTTTVSYEEVKNKDGSEKKTVRYEHGTYTVVDEWNTKPVTDTVRADNADDLKNLLNQYKSEGKTVSSVKIPFWFFDYSVKDINNTSWVDDVLLWVNKNTGGDGFDVNVSYEVEDKTNPKKTHEEDGIYEIVEKDYKETTENETKFESGSFGVHIEIEAFGKKIVLNDAKGEADKAMRDKVTSLMLQGYEVIDYDLDQELFDGKWGVTYWVKYKATTSQTVTKVVSKKLYAADTYSTYNALVKGDPAKPATSGKAGNDAQYGQKIVIQSDSEARKKNGEYSVKNNLGEYINNIKALQENKSELVAAAAKVDAALTRVQELKERIKELKNVSLASTSALNELNSQLQLAQKALADANSKKEVLAQKVAEAQKVVDSINLDRFKSSAAPSDDDPGMDDQDNPDDDDDDDSSSEEPGSGAGVAGTGTIVASAGTIPVISLPATAAGVAGARTGRRTSRSGVAGVRVDNGEGDGDAAKNVVEPKAVATTNGKNKNAAGADKKFVKLENNEVPLADKPFEEGTNMNLLWLLAAAIAAGACVYAYDKHRKKVAANEESKKYKK